MCDQVESGKISLSSHAAGVTRACGHILARQNEGEDIATPETCSRIAALLVQLQQSNNLHLSALDPDTAYVAQAAMDEFRLSRCNIVSP